MTQQRLPTTPQNATPPPTLVTPRPSNLPPVVEPVPAPSGVEQQARRVWRFGLLALGLIVLMTVVLLRLVIYQVVQQADSPLAASSQLVQPARGTIVDRDGELLAADRFFYQVVASPKDLKTDADRLLVAQTLAQVIGLPVAESQTMLVEYKSFAYIELVKRLDLALGNHLLDFLAKETAANPATPLRYLNVRPVPDRFYPQNSLASHLVGFTHADSYGVYGVEEYYDNFLNSSVGLLERDVKPFESLPAKTRRYLPSVAGRDLVLTFDRSIQWIIEEELREAIAKYRAKTGSIIVMEPQTGAILGLANWPDYDPNQRQSGNVDVARFPNPSVSALFEPGSVFKLITMAGGLDTGVITPTTVFTDDGYIVVGQRTIYNSSRTANGQVTVEDALAKSLNVVTAQVADRMGSDDFYRYVRRFGFGTRTEVDLADEVAGLLKTPGNELWSQSDLGTNSFGQGLAVTPLQMANAVCAIANGGTLMRPYLVQARIEDGKVLYTKPTVVRTVISPQSAADLTEMMIYTVNTGNKAAVVPGWTVAGKSGTAQIPSPEGYREDATIVSFVGFAPANDPKFVVLVKLDEPDFAISQWAAYTAAPVFAQVARRLFEHLNIPPDEIRNQVAVVQ